MLMDHLPNRLTNWIGLAIALLLIALYVQACQVTHPPDPDPERDLIEEGRRLFFSQTFSGNGRTCGTCHRVGDNFSITPNFIATLPDNDPLFVAEFNPQLSKNFENPRLLREFGLITENLDGFSDLENKFTLRGVPHVLAQRTSIDSPEGPRTGWSGDGSPGDGSLRSFAIGAVVQHFPKSLDRVDGVDFILPNERQLDALEAFMLSLGRQQELSLPLALKGTLSKRGQEIFLDNTSGKCNICHANAGSDARLAGNDLGNANFDTGVEDLPDQPARLTGEKVPADDGFGIPGDGTFNTPPLVEAADSGPFFHNNSIDTIEGAVAFYNGDAFNNSPAGRLLASIDPAGIGIRLDATQVVAVAAFLRAINALENIRSSLELLEARSGDPASATDRLLQAQFEIEDSEQVLSTAGLNQGATQHLRNAQDLVEKALNSWFFTRQYIENAIVELKKAQGQLVGS